MLASLTAEPLKQGTPPTATKGIGFPFNTNTVSFTTEEAGTIPLAIWLVTTCVKTSSAVINSPVTNVVSICPTGAQTV